jgi:hypothetical protein
MFSYESVGRFSTFCLDAKGGAQKSRQNNCSACFAGSSHGQQSFGCVSFLMCSVPVLFSATLLILQRTAVAPPLSRTSIPGRPFLAAILPPNYSTTFNNLQLFFLCSYVVNLSSNWHMVIFSHCRIFFASLCASFRLRVFVAKIKLQPETLTKQILHIFPA